MPTPGAHVAYAETLLYHMLSIVKRSRLATILLELPVAVVERADLARLQPARDAVEVEGVLL
jgi:hypothetical protein